MRRNASDKPLISAAAAISAQSTPHWLCTGSSHSVVKRASTVAEATHREQRGLARKRRS
jgi:hypothetical protein